jgi:hypothetical protein
LYTIKPALGKPEMDRQQISLKLTLDALNVPLRLDSFADRMTLQKMIYLCQQAGVHLGYRYNWYLRGPYSPDLTRDAFDLKARQGSGFDDTAGWNLDATSLQRLEKVRPLWESRSPAERPRWLELLASVLFLKRSYDGRNKDAAGLRTILERNDKHFSESEIRNTMEELVRHGLLPGTASR